MKRSTQNKYVQTDPVIILPISTYRTKSENTTLLENRQNEIDESTEYEYPRPQDHDSLKRQLFQTYATSTVPPPIPARSQKTHLTETYDGIDDSPYELSDYNTEKKQLATRNYSYDMEHESSYETIPETEKKMLTLFSAIYILKESLSFHDTDDWEAGDELEFIGHVQDNPNMLLLKHLRTSTIKSINRSCVELDENTPLRLGITDRGTIECFLLKCDARYSFLIHRSSQNENVYILSVNQHHITKEALISHYFIRINKENNCFYLEYERKLRNCFFPTFQQLVNDAKVHQFIPLSKPIDRNLAMNEDELWQIDYKQLIIGKNIGDGEFGEVMEAKWKRLGLFKHVDVAIKRLKLNNVASNEFAKEIRTMKRLRNRYLVSFLGISVDPRTNDKLIVTEFMIDGDLKNWLEKQIELPADDILLNYSHQMCLGMAYLERNNYIHRDLACRNVLLRGDRAKISDFGMAIIAEEDPYYAVSNSKQKIGKLPYRWTAPEIFAGANFTTRSDVWSFGICLVEIWSKGGLPYPSLKHVMDVKVKIDQGYVHEKPSQCPKIYYNIIKSCLIKDPEWRPSFKKLADHFKSLLIKENENNTKRNVKTDNAVIPYYNIKGKEGSPVVNLQTSTSSKNANDKQNNSTINKNQYLDVNVMATKQQFSSSLPNDGSEYITATVDDPKNYRKTSSASFNNNYLPCSTHENDKRYSSPSLCHLAKRPTTDSVYVPSESANEKVDSNEETENCVIFSTFF